ncbi:hypothetical protein [Microbulbifer sp. VAAF005]|uniref:hypothetical protein n=1 Tax=Microbulbifer sp. VAAF005 TaxID=3034230 RepID=UPI0024ADECED|nr:hypothetical protein [Microbulbifer sp. VAAF005]WHI46556.1 hypothetical protein P0078_23095 [Microbulbifer sp. VAAF005]
MEISKFPLNKQASAVIAEVKKFVSAFERIKNKKPTGVAVDTDKFKMVQRAIVAELRRQKKGAASAKEITPRCTACRGCFYLSVCGVEKPYA